MGMIRGGIKDGLTKLQKAGNGKKNGKKKNRRGPRPERGVMRNQRIRIPK